MKNYAMKMCSVKRLERTELEMPVAAADQVVVKIEYCGICGSDMHFFQNGAIGTRRAPPDFILGHESAGTVIEVGKDVTTLKVGGQSCLGAWCSLRKMPVLQIWKIQSLPGCTFPGSSETAYKRCFKKLFRIPG